MRRVGLTGNIASGKSTVAAVWRRLGAPVIDADELARRAVEPGSPALEEIRRAFGPDVLDEQGRLDRERMRAVVFGDPEARRRLEAIVHPRVAELRAEEERRLADEGARVVVHEIPLLFEVGLEDEFDVIAFVDAPAAVRLERIVRDRGLDPAEARRMIDAQMPAAEKRARSDMVIRNDADLERLERRAEATWRAIATDAGRGDRIRIDMHIHTRASFDCLSEPERVLEAAVERGIDRICITDHNEIDAALELRSRH
ncbi:MAG: dephospho-CoA kinase, partial [Gemmatimonadota bacterium]